MAEFKEIGRCSLTDSEDAILSEMHKPDGTISAYYLTKFITSDKYSGPTKGIRIPEDMLVEFLKIFPLADLENAVSQLEVKETT